MSSKTDALKMVIVGHVDHGKSTLIGRLLYDTGSLPVERYEEIVATCERQNRPFEFAYLMDALEEEREQNITIETAQTFFNTDKRNYVIIDAPGHKEFLKNMITGSSIADAAILLVDAYEGVREQTRRHAYVLSLLGIKQIIVLINKLDRVDYDKATFEKVTSDIKHFLHSIGLVASYVIPMSAREGDNVAKKSDKTPYYDGPTFLDALDVLDSVTADETSPLRFPIQDIYRWDNKRIYAGRIESGTLRVGDAIVINPGNKKSRVKSIERWNSPDNDFAKAGESVGVTLDDELFAERGHVIAHVENAPLSVNELSCSIFWLGKDPLRRGGRYSFRIATEEVEAELLSIDERLDSSTLQVIETDAEVVENTETANVRFRTKRPVAIDTFDENMRLGRFVLAYDDRVAGGGIVRQLLDTESHRAAHRVIRLSDVVTDWPEPNVIDLRKENALVEFEADTTFLEALRNGERYLFRFNALDHLAPLTTLAYEYDLVYTFRREEKGLSALLRSKEPHERLTSRRNGKVGEVSDVAI
ncbi:MAG: GTP-binding protein [Deltaproteobacteria bacterium]|nr:GTP-binding protein [Deltaproteobacteria bacterium]